MTEIVRFKLPDEATKEEVEQDVGLALFVSACLHGGPGARLDTGVLVHPSGRRCVLSVRGPGGETALRVLIGLCDERFGEGGYELERVATE
jgi:hypothetical protein